MKQQRPFPTMALFLCAALISFDASAQRIKHWIGGSGAWSDPAHWSLAAGGAGGAGAPQRGEHAVIAGFTPFEVEVDVAATCAGLALDGSRTRITFSGDGTRELTVAGDLVVQGDVDWTFPGQLHMVKDEGVVALDAHGVRLRSDVQLDGDAQWELRSALVLDGDLILRAGALRLFDGVVQAGALRSEGRARKRVEAGGAYVIVGSLSIDQRRTTVDAEDAMLMVGGQLSTWDGAPRDAEAFRGITNCGTGVGQIPFQVNAFVTSDYNGFGVTCNGACNGSVNVSVTGGSGNFSLQWQSGPNGTGTSLPWSNLCAGNKLVIVTDLGQNVGCFANALITPPPPLGVLFFGLNPPSCADVCNGTAVTFPGGGTGAGYVYNWNNGTESSSNPSQLCAGVNTLQLRDNNNCIFDTTFTINLLPLAATLTSTDVLCAGDCNGTGSVNVSGGTPGYSYNWGPGTPAGDGTPSVTGLCPGAYTVVVADANGCDTTIAFTLIEPAPIVPGLAFTDATCSNSCDGTASVAPSGTAGPYTFDWSPDPITGDGTGAVSGLCAGNYTVLITDASTGCDTLVSFVIGSAPAIDVQLTFDPASCSGTCDGSAGILISGGTPGYSILWSPGIIQGQGTPNVTQLCPGDYSVTVTDAAGCDTTLAFTIDAPDPIDPIAVVTDVRCSGACNGTITFIPTGGSGVFTYAWAPPPPVGDGTAAAGALCAGDWTVTIADQAGCDTTVTIPISEPPPLVVVPAQTNISCGTDCDGTASVSVSGGTAPYTYDWSGTPNGDGSPAVTDLCAGVYTVEVLDSALCAVIQTFFIAPPQPLQVGIVTVNATCPDLCNGTATATVTGGNDPYTYLWSPTPGGGQSTPNATGLCAQDYILTVTDSVGCDTSTTFTITAPLPIDPQAIVTDATCAGVCNGSIVLSPTGGFGTFTYAWNPQPPNGPGQAQALNLCAGTWSVTVSSGVCDTVLVFEILEPDPLVAELVTTPAGCDGSCDGTAAATVSGGTPGYTYVWSPQPGTGQGTPNAGGLCPGSYSLSITDAALCDTVITFTIQQPPPIVALLSTTLASCGGACDGSASLAISGGSGPVGIVWSPEPGIGQNTTNAGGLCPGPWSVTLTDSLGCDTTIDFIIGTPSGILAVPTVVDATCSDLCDGTIDLSVTGGVPGYAFLWTPAPPIGGDSSVAGLCAGQWTVQIADQAGCDTTLVFSIGAPAPILPNGTFTNETCNGPCDGTASVDPTGGSGAFTFLWSPTPPIGDGTANVSGLCAGDWSVTITDGSGCDTTWMFTVLPEQPITPELDVIDATCFDICNGSATVNPSGGSGGFTYLWTPQPPVGQGTPSVSGLCLGQWEVTITDSLGCDTTVVFFVDKPSAITTSLVFAPADCSGPCTGEAAAFPSGGTPGYSFLWQPDPGTGQGEFYVNGLCAGTTYSLTVTDSLGCDTTETFLVPDFTPISPFLSIAPASCSNLCDGTAMVDPAGGEGPYTFDWTPDPPNGDGSNEATGLCPGTYDVLITDVNGCDTAITFLITSPDPIDPVPTVTPIACNGDCNGVIALATQGGTGSYTYTWSPQPPVGQGTATASQLCPGIWSVTVSDGAGCDTTLSFTLTEPPVLVVQPEITPSQCQACIGAVTLNTVGGGGGYFYAWGPPLNITTSDSVQTGLCAGIYTVIVGDALGCVTQISVPITDSDGEVLAVTSDTVTCPTDCDGTLNVGFDCTLPSCSIAWYDGIGTDLNVAVDEINGLCPGTYLVEVTNGGGCVSIAATEVLAPEAITALVSSTPTSCAGSCDGSAAIGISGGIGPYQITWDPAPPVGQGGSNVSGLCAGPYGITVTDAGGCSILANVLILGPDPIDPSPVIQDISCSGLCDGSVALNTQGGSAPYTYLWNPPPPNGQGGASATQLCAGNYSVNISDANGCDTTLAFVIAEPQPLVLVPSSTPSNCQVCDGTGTVQSSGGTGSPEITWTGQGGSLIGTGPALVDLCAGIYSVSAVDDNGCSAQAVVVISDASGESLTVADGQTTCANNCDGSVSVSFVCQDGPCAITWFDSTGANLASNQFSLSDLCTGDYFVQVVNGAGCAVIDTASVTPSQLLIPNLGTTPVTCHGDCDGTAAVGPTGGTAPYTYDWGPDPIAGDGTPAVSGLCPGVYTLFLSESGGCDTLINVLILEPAAINAIAQVSDISCNGACDGGITVNAAGGSGPLSFTWTPDPPVGQGTTTVAELCPGDWTLVIGDSLGCDTSITFTVQEPPQLTVVTTSTLSTCNICSGTMTATVTGGTPGYSYDWTQGGSVFGSDSALFDVCAGLYQVLVTDANGCQVQQAVPVSDADGEVLDATGDVVTCPGSCDGQVAVDFTCSVPGCTITWLDGAGNDLGQSGPQVADLCAGTYFVQVVNGNGCVSLDTAIVAEPPPIIPNLGTTQPTCAGQCDGTAVVGPTGGTAPYTYDWSPDPIAGDSTGSVTGLCAGTYSVLISDSAGCSILVDVLILQPAPISAAPVISPITCNGACDAAIDLNAGGGTGQLSFSWSPEPGNGQGTGTVTGLCAGEWTVLVADSNGCDTTLTFIFNDPPVLVVDVSTIDNLCYGDCSGSALANVTGGSTPYLLTWTTSGGVPLAQGDTLISGLCAGDYLLEVADSNNCAVSLPFTIGQGIALDAALGFLGETCNGPCDGFATVQPSGGAGGYSVTWTDPDGNVFATDTTAISGLCAGNWAVVITDSLGCDSTFNFTLLPFTSIAANEAINPITCGGGCDGSITLAPTGGIGNLSFAWSPVPPNGDGTPAATGLCAGDWSVTITDDVGCDTTVTFTLSEPPPISIVVDEVIDASCNTANDGSISTTVSGGIPGLELSWTGPGVFTANGDDIADIAPGDYVLTVQDANGCSAQQTVTVSALSTVVAVADEDISVCFGATIILDGSSSQGAGSYQWSNAQGDVIGDQPLLDAGTLSPGGYFFVLTVSDGPCSDADTVLVDILALPLADAGPDQDIFIDGSVTIGGQPSGPPGSAFQWSPDSLVSDPTASDPLTAPPATTWFVLTVTSPDGCTDQDSVLVTVVPQVVIPSGFTPNGDGSNDVWQIDYIDRFPDCTVEIYNRWGEQLFRSVGYRVPWDGRYSGGLVPVGTYYYAIELNDERFPEPYTGPLTVIR